MLCNISSTRLQHLYGHSKYTISSLSIKALTLSNSGSVRWHTVKEHASSQVHTSKQDFIICIIPFRIKPVDTWWSYRRSGFQIRHHGFDKIIRSYGICAWHNETCSRMPSSGMLRRVAHVRTDVSEELSASIIRVTRICELGTTLAVTINRRTLRRNTMC
jgi:hypothetical protein